MSRKTVLITGGAGFVGRATVSQLTRRGWHVVILDALDAQVHGDAFPALPSGVDFILGDVCDAGLVRHVLRKVDAVLHLSARTGVGQSMYALSDYVGTNVGGTAVLLEALTSRDHTVRRLVLSSSRAVYGEGAYVCPTCGPVAPGFRTPEQLAAGQWDVRCPRCAASLEAAPTREEKLPQPNSIYAITKQAQEELCRCIGQAYGIETVILRYFNVYGTGQPLSNPYTGLIPALAARVLSDQAAELYEDGQPLRDFVHVNDVARANALALEADGLAGVALNVGCGVPVSLRETAETVTRALGGRHDPVVSGKYRIGDVRHCYADISQAGQALDYRPSISFGEGVASMAGWLRDQYAGDFSGRAALELQQHGLLGVAGQ